MPSAASPATDPTTSQRLPVCEGSAGPDAGHYGSAECTTFCMVPPEDQEDNFTNTYAVFVKGFHSVQGEMDCSYIDTYGYYLEHIARCGPESFSCYGERTGWMKDSGTSGQAWRITCTAQVNSMVAYYHLQFACGNARMNPIEKPIEGGTQWPSSQVHHARPGDEVCIEDLCVPALANAISGGAVEGRALAVECYDTCFLIPVDCGGSPTTVSVTCTASREIRWAA